MGPISLLEYINGRDEFVDLVHLEQTKGILFRTNTLHTSMKLIKELHIYKAQSVQQENSIH